MHDPTMHNSYFAWDLGWDQVGEALKLQIFACCIMHRDWGKDYALSDHQFHVCEHYLTCGSLEKKHLVLPMPVELKISQLKCKPRAVHALYQPQKSRAPVDKDFPQTSAQSSQLELN